MRSLGHVLLPWLSAGRGAFPAGGTHLADPFCIAHLVGGHGRPERLPGQLRYHLPGRGSGG